MQMFNRETNLETDRIVAEDIPDMEKFIKLFDWVTTRFGIIAEQEIDLARALGDKDAVVKHQIKLSTMKLCREMFEDCYLRATGLRTPLWKKASK